MSSTLKSPKLLLDRFKALSEVLISKVKIANPIKIVRTDTRKLFSRSKKDSGNEDIRRRLITKMGHFKYGLYTEDLISEDIPAVKEAIKRLPVEVYDARAYRIIRAIALDSAKIYLPQDQWVSYEEDCENAYLILYIKEVEYERQEKRNHGCLDTYLYIDQ